MTFTKAPKPEAPAREVPAGQCATCVGAMAVTVTCPGCGQVAKGE